MGKIKFFVVVGLFCMGVMTNLFAEDLLWDEIGGGQRGVKTILLDDNLSKIVFTGSSNGVFKSEDKGENWRNVLSVRGGKHLINLLTRHPQNKEGICALSSEGLFLTLNSGKSWNRVFRGKNNLENDCLSIAFSKEKIFLGTGAGLFVSIDNGRNWSRVGGEIDAAKVLSITSNNPFVYVVSSKGVFRSKDGGAIFEKIFNLLTPEMVDDPENLIEERDKKNFTPSCIVLDKNSGRTLYLGTSKGVYQSFDSGDTWQFMPEYGLINRNVKKIILDKDGQIYALTDSGIFVYKNQRWEEITLRLLAGAVNQLVIDKKGALLVAAENGVFLSDVQIDKSSQFKTNQEYTKAEPSIRQVQEAAIKYAEVQPEKIANWRKQLSKKAFLPRVSVGIDRDTSDLWHWESGSTTKTNDDTLCRGKETLGWDVSLSWDLGELIWASDQTSIDTRSKLMVELREGIVDEVTKLYFERLRVKMDLDNIPIEDRRKLMEKELKLQELTASIDGITGGFFSRSLK